MENPKPVQTEIINGVEVYKPEFCKCPCGCGRRRAVVHTGDICPFCTSHIDRYQKQG